MAIKIVIGIVVVLIIGIVAFVIYKTKVRDDIEDGGKYSDELLRLIMKDRTYDKLKEISYSSSGDSNGNIYHVTLYVDEKKVVEERKDYVSEPLMVREFSVSDTDIELILNDIEEYNFPEWKDLKINQDEIALDAPSRGITFVYDNGKSRLESYHIDFNMSMPEDGREALGEFRNFLTGLVKEANKIKETSEEKEGKVEEPQIISSYDPSALNPQ